MFTVARDVVWVPLRLFVIHDATTAQVWLRWTSFAVVGAAVLSLVIGMIQALGAPVVRRVSVPIDGLHPDLEGMRIVQLSDIHLSPWKDGEDLELIVDTWVSLDPELVVITGDLVDGNVAHRGKDSAPLGSLPKPVFFVTGNHDFYSGAAGWIAHLRGLGIDVIDGESRRVKRGEAVVLVAGLADPAVGQAEARMRNPALVADGGMHSDLKVLLAHRTGDAYAAAKAGFDLQLSGHTHGGQFFPWTLLIDRIQPFATGLHRHEGMWIHASVGVGFWGPPVRFLNPPEIVLLTLERAST